MIAQVFVFVFVDVYHLVGPTFGQIEKSQPSLAATADELTG
jgi:hypothetical protein